MAFGRLIIGAADPALLSSGLPAVGALLTVYLTGTTTLATLYADANGDTVIANPQTSNAAGRFYEQSTTIWASTSENYDVTLNYPDGTELTYTDLAFLVNATGAGAYMPITGGTFTGPVYGLTPAENDDSTQLATTAFVQGELAAYATLISPAFTGDPTAPTQSAGDDSTKIATTAYVDSAVAGGATNLSANCTITGGALTVNENTGFSAIGRSSAGAYNFTFTTAKANNYYKVFPGIENVTDSIPTITNKTTGGFSLSTKTTSNVPGDPSGFSILVVT
jgi:hypothetical protein